MFRVNVKRKVPSRTDSLIIENVYINLRFLTPLVIWVLIGPQFTFTCSGYHGYLLRVNKKHFFQRISTPSYQKSQPNFLSISSSFAVKLNLAKRRSSTV